MPARREGKGTFAAFVSSSPAVSVESVQPIRDLAIETIELRKVFRNSWNGQELTAVDGISLRVPRGTTFGLLGPNGAGKTTFVKMLLSACHATSGRALIFGKDASLAESRRPIGYLPENHRFPTYFTGRGMLEFYGALSAAPHDAQSVDALSELVGLERRWLDVRIGKYSKGMLQRLGLAQALIHKPRILILDEPTDGVDPVGRRHIREVLRRLEEEGVTILLNSHLLVEVEEFCREVAIVNRGRVILEGKMKDLTAGKGYRVIATRGPDRQDLMFRKRSEANAALDDLRREGWELESFAATHSKLEDIFIQAVKGQ
jgi:ABC-2 type transport system ATP-binding protein